MGFADLLSVNYRILMFLICLFSIQAPETKIGDRIGCLLRGDPKTKRAKLYYFRNAALLGSPLEVCINQ